MWGMEWLELAQDRDRWRALVTAETKQFNPNVFLRYLHYNMISDYRHIFRPTKYHHQWNKCVSWYSGQDTVDAQLVLWPQRGLQVRPECESPLGYETKADIVNRP